MIQFVCCFYLSMIKIIDDFIIQCTSLLFVLVSSIQNEKPLSKLLYTRILTHHKQLSRQTDSYVLLKKHHIYCHMLLLLLSLLLFTWILTRQNVFQLLLNEIISAINVEIKLFLNNMMRLSVLTK